jgi:transposase
VADESEFANLDRQGLIALVWKLRARISELEARDALISELEARNSELEARDALLSELEARNSELETRINQTPRNSSKPPGSEGLEKPKVNKDRSLRRSTGRKAGGQQGHQGHTLKRVETPDEIRIHRPQCCDECHNSLDGAPVIGQETRQVFDIPEEVMLEVVEHIVQKLRCEGCGRENKGSFPLGVSAPTVYGPRIQALAVYLRVFQHLPYERACETLKETFQAHISAGTLSNWITRASDELTEFDQELKKLLRDSDVLHMDETGARIAGRLGWVHCQSTENLTRYRMHAKRGQEAIDDADVLPGFDGVAVHDGWMPYKSYEQAEHALCNAHHLRELAAAEEAGCQWAIAMQALLLDALAAVRKARKQGQDMLSDQELAQLLESYSEIIEMGHEEHPETGKRKRSKAHNLLLRLDRYQADVLRFAVDFKVPFSNNLCERDVRPVKTQLKVSACWRTDDGAKRYLKIRSYLSTAKKQGLAPAAVLRSLAGGEPWMPAHPPAPG